MSLKHSPDSDLDHNYPRLCCAEPWWLVINMVGGGYIGYHVAQKYDATNGFLAQQFGAYTKMPTWAYGQLTSEELGK